MSTKKVKVTPRKTTTTTAEPLIITPAQLAERLGIPRRTIYYWLSEGVGPRSIVIGRRVYYRPSDVEAWLDSNTQESGKG